MLDLAGNGFATRGLDDTVRFDLDADGRSDRISAPSGDDALLALDRNGNTAASMTAESCSVTRTAPPALRRTGQV